MPLSVVSYNILATSYVRSSFYPGVADVVLAPEGRIPLLLRRLRAQGADVMCLQEVETHTFELIERELGSLGYVGHFAQKHGKPDGCATFVKREIATVDAEPMYFRDGRGTETDSGHLALLVVVREARGRIGIANAHFKWDPPATLKEDRWGYRQASQLLAHLDSTEYRDTPWVICGDFNVEPGSELTALFESAKFVDAYGDRTGTYSCVSHRSAKRIDFVWHSGLLASHPMNVPEITDVTLLPSETEPSDHIAIGAWLEHRSKSTP